MINPFEVIETIKMVDEENLDIRTITMGISLKSCAGPDVDTVCEKVYEKITTYAKDLVKTGEDIEAQFGIPIINKRISVTPIATLVDALEEPTVEKCVKIAKTLDKAAKKTGVNFIGGYTALCIKIIRTVREYLLSQFLKHLPQQILYVQALMWVRQEPVSIWTLLNRWVRLLRERLNLQPIRKDLRVQSLLYSATRLRIIRLWRARSLAKARVNVL
mgnify:CR=1 FL=1